LNISKQYYNFNDAYIKALSEDVVKFCKCKDYKNIRLTHDDCDDIDLIKKLGYKCTGTGFIKRDGTFDKSIVDRNNLPSSE
jgi:hypothetical protein